MTDIRRLKARVVSPDDWRVWRTLRLEALADAADAFESTLSDWASADERRWRQRLEEVPFNVMAIIGEDVVGQASGTNIGADGRCELISMYVSRDARGAGAAEALAEAVCDWAAAAGATAVRLFVRRSNARAIRLYDRVGFVPVDEPADDPAEIAMVRSLIP